MEGNKEEALRCLSIAQRHRSSSNLSSALKFARKSVALYATPEGEAMVVVIEREVESGGSASTSTSSGSTTTTAPKENGSAAGAGASARASGVEEHVTSAHSRPGHGAKAAAESSGATSAAAAGDKGKKREYTAKQMEVVKRVKGCKHHEYYKILAIESSCTEGDVKKAYRKLALSLHPDKNGAPGADEAFKMVSKAFQVLSDADLRAAFDANPQYDPTQRNPGVPSGFGGGRGGGGMGMHPGFGGGGFQGEINPEDLFNMFFGGGGGGFGGGSPFGQANVFTFGGPGGFQGYNRRRPQPGPARQGDAPSSPLVALLPIIILFLFAMISILPSLLSSSSADPGYSFEPTQKYGLGRTTFNWNVPYYVDQAEWEKSEVWKSVPEGKRGVENAAAFSQGLRRFEKGVEGVYVRRLQNDCQHFNDVRQQRIQDASGFFGIGADYEKINQLRAQKSPACEQLRAWRIGQYAQW